MYSLLQQATFVISLHMLYFLNANKNNLPLSQDISVKLATYYNLLNSKIPLLESDNYTRFILNLDVPIESEETRNTINKIRNVVNNNYDDVLLIGNSVNAIDLESSFTSDNLIITAVTIIFIAIILIMTFKSFGMTILLISAIEGITIFVLPSILYVCDKFIKKTTFGTKK